MKPDVFHVAGHLSTDSASLAAFDMKARVEDEACHAVARLAASADVIWPSVTMEWEQDFPAPGLNCFRIVGQAYR